ncbi:MAG: nucleotide exchange factor GrpE [Bacteroidota bacterium]|jgi:molecular chaperone GrpE
MTNMTEDTPGGQTGEHELQDAKVEQSDPVALMEAALSESQDKYLRLVAEFENYKKRTVRERMDLIKTAASESILAVLPVMDDFERAIKAGTDTGNPVAEGILLIYNKLKSALEAKGLKPMDAVGQPFDSELHDAIVQAPAPGDDAKGKVLEELTKGYFLNDKVLRHAKVVVAV